MIRQLVREDILFIRFGYMVFIKIVIEVLKIGLTNFRKLVKRDIYCENLCYNSFCLLTFGRRDVKVDLIKKIRVKQEEMIKIGSQKGLSSPEVIKCSEELDQLINAYMKSKIKVKESSP